MSVIVIFFLFGLGCFIWSLYQSGKPHSTFMKEMEECNRKLDECEELSRHHVPVTAGEQRSPVHQVQIDKAVIFVSGTTPLNHNK